MSPERERLQAFLYLLMRDQLPSGKVESVMQNVRSAMLVEQVIGGLSIGRFKQIAYSVPELATYAGRLADELLTGAMDIRPTPLPDPPS